MELFFCQLLRQIDEFLTELFESFKPCHTLLNGPEFISTDSLTAMFATNPSLEHVVRS
jgi:hypothetical protein